MKNYLLLICIFLASSSFLNASTVKDSGKIRLLVVTGGHEYNIVEFNKMLSSMEADFDYQVTEFPAAFDYFLPGNRNKYDVLVFYHMWQNISPDQARSMAECIAEGKPLVVLHHSICAFDDWPEYVKIIGGKYFHKPSTVNGKEYPPSSYIHDIKIRVKIVDRKNPVTRGLHDFDIFDETYKGFYVDKGVTPILSTDEPSSTPVIGWTKMYGKARVVTLQSGHDSPTYANPAYRKLLKQAIEWAYNKGKNQIP